MKTYIYVKPYDKDEQHSPDSWSYDHVLNDVYKFDGIQTPKAQYVEICVWFNHLNPIHKALLMSKESTLWRVCIQMSMKDDILTFEFVGTVNTNLFHEVHAGAPKALFDFAPLEGVVSAWGEGCQDEATE